ncbi:hypothetical protein OLZ31_02580 [Enterobacter asburiae]|nr:hypothetical protein [Enterobacter asburiae]
MGEQKISIVCEGLSNEETLELMKRKVQANELLESALTEKAYLLKALNDVEFRIEQLSVEAAVDVSSAGRDCDDLIPFYELPKEVQLVAANFLRDRMSLGLTKKPAELALEVGEAFIRLFSVR